MSDERTRYRERSDWPVWAQVVVWGAVVLSCFPILAGWDSDLSSAHRWAIVLAICVGVGGLGVLVGGLTVLVQESRIVVHLGRVGLIKKTIPFSEVMALTSVQYRPIAEFGGWGVRGFGKRRAWTARGDRAVRLDLTGERELLVGSDHPHRLEERIRTLAGARLGGVAGTAPDDRAAAEGDR